MSDTLLKSHTRWKAENIRIILMHLLMKTHRKKAKTISNILNM